MNDIVFGITLLGLTLTFALGCLLLVRRGRRRRETQRMWAEVDKIINERRHR